MMRASTLARWSRDIAKSAPHGCWTSMSPQDGAGLPAFIDLSGGRSPFFCDA